MTGTVRGVGNYSRLACEFYFVRSLGYYIIHIYVPSCLIVVLSWISFWLHRDASPARVSLGITTVLTMTTILSSSNASLPKISYLKSIDIFLVTCFIMVFASLLEYACVSFLGLVKPTTTMMKAGRQQQQLQRYHHRYQSQPVRQSRDYLLDTAGSPWDSGLHGVFIIGKTRTTVNGSTSQHGFQPRVISFIHLYTISTKHISGPGRAIGRCVCVRLSVCLCVRPITFERSDLRHAGSMFGSKIGFSRILDSLSTAHRMHDFTDFHQPHSTTGWIKIALGMEVALGPDHIVL